MEEFFKLLSRFGSIELPQFETIVSKATELQLTKGELVWHQGKRTTHVGFLQDGVLRVYYHNEKGDEITSYFIEEGHWISDWENSDGTFIPEVNLQAITDCNMIVFTKKEWEVLTNQTAGLNTIIQKITTQHKSQKLKRRSPLVSIDATERYLSFLVNYPHLINRIPLSYVASYLGIKQPSLSRIRKQI